MVLLGWLALAACGGRRAPSADAGVSAAFDSGTPEAPDSGTVKDAGTVWDAGASTDGAVVDLEPFGPCNVGLWQTALPYLDGGSPGDHVLGLRDAAEVLELAGGTRLDGPVYLFNGATLQITPGDGGFVTIAGDVNLFGHSRFVSDAGRVRVAQTAGTSFHLYAADESQVVMANTALILGSTENNLYTIVACGRSKVELRLLDLTRGEKSTPTPFAFDSAEVVVENPNDFVELSINAQAHGAIRDSRSATVGAYLIVSDSVHHDLHLPSGFIDGGHVSQLLTEDGGVGAQLEVSNSYVLYGLWTHPKTNITLLDSAIGLFLKFDSTVNVAALSGEVAARTETLGIGDRSLQLVRSSVSPVNAYFEPERSGTLSLTDSAVGELTCNGPTGTVCSLNGSRIDGTGGFATVAGNAHLDMQDAELNTYLLTRDNAVAHLTRVAHRPNADLPPAFRKPLSILATGDSLVVLENQNPFVSVTEDGGVVPQSVSENAAVVNAAMYLDPSSPADTELGPAVTKPIYGAASVNTQGARHVLRHWALAATNGATTLTLATSSTSMPPLSTLGVLDTSKLDAGTWVLHLTVDLKSGRAADVMHTIHVAP